MQYVSFRSLLIKKITAVIIVPKKRRRTVDKENIVSVYARKRAAAHSLHLLVWFLRVVSGGSSGDGSGTGGSGCKEEEKGKVAQEGHTKKKKNARRVSQHLVGPL
ncbi:hypothetical protein M0802_015293 [Mischocyttarus mexicanus]|nr:hypothetical protein M0802_015293 [Mischocyttarus mexicanus]